MHETRLSFPDYLQCFYTKHSFFSQIFSLFETEWCFWVEGSEDVDSSLLNYRGVSCYEQLLAVGKVLLEICFECLRLPSSAAVGEADFNISEFCNTIPNIANLVVKGVVGETHSGCLV